MAEAVAGFYAVETVLEGAAVTGYAVSRPTVPLHVTFERLSLPKESPDIPTFKPSLHHSFNIIKGRGYIFGGDTSDGSQDACMTVVTLPSSLETGEVDLQLVEPRAASDRPLQPYSDSTTITEKGDLKKSEASEATQSQAGNQTPEPRAAHAATAIDTNIFIISGRKPQALHTPGSTEPNPSTPLFDCDTVHSFSTQTNDWTTFHANVSQCKDGIPEARTSASCTSNPSPQSASGVDITIHPHGTIFLHGGYNTTGTLLRDTWTFSIRTLIWKRWPDLPVPSATEVAGEGRIISHGTTLIRVGDGFGKVSHLNYEVVQAPVVTSNSGPIEQEVDLVPRTKEWETKTTTHEILSEQPLTKTESLPMPRRNAGFVPITTGAGRYYNIYFMGQDGPESILNDIWSYQVAPDETSLASVKDSIRKFVGKGTGENEWAMCEVEEKDEGGEEVELPRGLSGFAADVWSDLGGGNVVLWGGRMGDGTVVHEGWVMTLK